MKVWRPHENLTLTAADLAAANPKMAEGGRAIRSYCPFCGAGQRSLRVDGDSGRFRCFYCGVWGYTEEARRHWRERRIRNVTNPLGVPHGGHPQTVRSSSRPHAHRTQTDTPPRPDLPDLIAAYQAALPGSQGERYLRHRRIPLDLALRYSVGYAAPGKWPNRNWSGGRLAMPNTDHEGRVLNLYGRAVDRDRPAPDDLRHDHLPGRKGYFNAVVMRTGEGPLFVCEGVFDTLSLIAAGYPRTVAIIGVDGWRWEWARDITAMVLALDGDKAGQNGWHRIAREARLRGKTVMFLPPSAYGGHDDPSAAWMAGVLDVASHVGAAKQNQSHPPTRTPIRPEDVPSIFERLAGGPVRLSRQTVVNGVRRFEYEPLT